MDPRTLRDLLSPAGQEVLQAAMDLAPRPEDYLRHFQTLVRRHPEPRARAALEIAIARRAALAKFPQCERLYFSRESLEQASAYAVSSYRAGRYRDFSQVADLGCSAGGDTLALAAVAPTVGIDLDPDRLALAAANLQATGLAGRARLVQADLTAPLPLAPAPGLALFFDPARRSAGRRVFSVHAYHPPLAVVKDWLPAYPALGVKISPGVKLAELAGYPAELEFISLQGQLKEAVLWFGPFRTVQTRATLLPGPFTLVAAGRPGAGFEPPESGLPLREPQAYLYEPDPAVLRAGLVEALGEQLGAAQLDPDIAYLTADQQTSTPFARVWAVEEWFPFNLKRLRAYLRARGIGRVVVKKRGSPLDPEALIKKLRLKGDEGRVVVLTHLRGRPIVLICFEP
jgi:SAM-dependent methyltransferase